jgi:hypothetical protein
MISQKLSDSLRVSNLFCTILVIAIHYNTKHDMDLVNGFTWNYYFQEFLTNGIARIAVPFFAFVAGFFFFLSYKNISSYPLALKKRGNSIFIPYIIASTLIFIVDYCYGKIIWSSTEHITSQIIESVFLKPVSIQFWFLRDLIFLVLISPVIFIAIRQFKLWIVLPLLVLWLVDIEVTPLLAERHMITIETFSYFVLGCYLSQNLIILDKLIEVLSKRMTLYIFLVYIVLCIVRVYIDPEMANWYINRYEFHTLIIQNISILVGVFLVIKLSSFVISDRLIFLSQFTFFVYLFHLKPLSYGIGKLTSYLISDAYKFYLTFPLATLVIFIVAYLLKKTTPHVYKILSGNR